MRDGRLKMSLGDELRFRSSYTGESLRSLGNHRGRVTNSIPIADEQQRVLEAAVFRAFARMGTYSPNPLNIAQTQMLPTGTTVIELGRTAPIYWDLAADEEIIGMLLPSIDPEDHSYVSGGPGVRLDATESAGRSIKIRLLGTKAEVVIHAKGVRWERQIDAYEREVLSRGLIPVWNHKHLHPAERWELAMPYRRPSAPQTWIGSGLLRRAAAFQTFGRAYAVSAWEASHGRDALGWSIEINTHPSNYVSHARFISALTDRKYGLPLEVDEQKHHGCEIGQDGQESRQSDYCRHFLRSTLGDGGWLELRFWRELPPEKLREAMLSAGCRPRILDRIVPKDTK